MRTQPRPFLSPAHKHARDCRAVLAEHCGWQVLIHPRNTACYAARAGGGRLSLLLWHPRSGLSVLVPSAESGFLYELLAPDQPPRHIEQYAAIATILIEEYGVTPLPPERLTCLYARFVLSALIGATVPA